MTKTPPRANMRNVRSISRVDDDGGYWEKRDRSGLDDHFAKSREMLRQMKREEPMLYGPIKLPDGRIVDLIR